MMGLTSHSTGTNAMDKGLNIEKNASTDKVIALAGNPNVGKSTVFNELTGMKQHTGNWPGKTVTNAQGTHLFHGTEYIFVDLPGTYSLAAHSAEEEVARDFICFGGADAVVIVCDATCLERNLNLVLQTMEITSKVIVCVNLMDEARKKHIHVDLNELQGLLGVPVIGAAARSGHGLKELMEAVENMTGNEKYCKKKARIKYSPELEKEICILEGALKEEYDHISLDKRWMALRLLEKDQSIISSLNQYVSQDIEQNLHIAEILHQIYAALREKGKDISKMRDELVCSMVEKAERLAKTCVTFEREVRRDRKIDKILTSKWTGIPIMLLLLGGIFWITIVGANYPSACLSAFLFWIQDRLLDFFMWIHSPEWLTGLLVMGVYRVLAWVISVMLPPMAIFFPLFTLLEDFGYLPRVAFNLDHHFQKAGACGKQALTMCMGFGCNAAGIVGCRIIDSPRERLIAMLTNNFVPCNGRFPQPIKGQICLVVNSTFF